MSAGEQLEALQRLASSADECLEQALLGRLSLRQTLDTFLPTMGAELGAGGAFVRTRNEELRDETFIWGQATIATAPDGTSLLGGRTLVQRGLDIGDARVGTIGFYFAGDRTADGHLLEERVEAVAEQLDGILGGIQTAAEKQDLILAVTDALSDRVFERGLDAAVQVLFQDLPLSLLMLCWRDDLTIRHALRYRLYDAGGLVNDSDERRHAGVDRVLAAAGAAVLETDDHTLRTELGVPSGVEAILIGGPSGPLGKILVASADDGLSTFAHDLVRIFGECIGQRLVDFNRERRHLAQFFGAPVIDQLLRDPDYAPKYLAPHEERCALIYADINGFTRICEEVLVTPERIGRFVDRWSAAAVNAIWRHGGVFDKMVGDCVIGIFGPPFGTATPAERALAALRAAREIQDLTARMEASEADLARLRELGLPGLGVAIGVNHCPLFVGLFGPNQDFTGFSSGMNATARLQALAGFRETLAMSSVKDALEGNADPLARALRFGDPRETSVKNVRQPLRYHRVDFE